MRGRLPRQLLRAGVFRGILFPCLAFRHRGGANLRPGSSVLTAARDGPTSPPFVGLPILPLSSTIPCTYRGLVSARCRDDIHWCAKKRKFLPIFAYLRNRLQESSSFPQALTLPMRP